VEKKRSIGVMVISIVNLLVGLPVLFLCLRFFISNYEKFISQLGDLSFFSVFVFILYVLMALTAVCFPVLFSYAGISTYNLKPGSVALNKAIAKWTIVFVGGGEVIFAVTLAPHLMIRMEFSLLVTLAAVLYFMWVQMYFTHPKVKEQFK